MAVRPHRTGRTARPPQAGDGYAGEELLSALSDAVLWQADPKTLRFTFVTQSAGALLGYPVEQWLQPDFWAGHIHPEDREAAVNECLSANEHRRDHELEYRMIAADGRSVWVRDRVQVVLDAQGELCTLRGLIVDITEHKRVQQRLLAQYTVSKILAEAHTIEEAAPRILQRLCETLDWDVGGIWVMDGETGALVLREIWHAPSLDARPFVAASRTKPFQTGAGLTGRIWATGEPCWLLDIAADDNFPRAPAALQIGLTSGCGFPISLGHETLGVMEFFSRERRPPDDALLEAFASLGRQVGQFIAHRRFERELRESETRFHKAFQASPAAISITRGRDRVFLDANAAFCETLGYAREELVGKPVDDFGIWPSAEEAERFRRTIAEEGSLRQAEFRLRTRSGELRDTIGSVEVVDLSGEPCVLALFYDITERKRMEEELRESEKRHRLAMDAGELGAWEWSVQTGEVAWSESLELIHGIPPGSFAGTFEAYLEDVHPDDRDALVEQIQASVSKGTHDVEYRIIRPDGETRWVSGTGRVVHDHAGMPARMIGVCQDITERKEIEWRQHFLAEAAAVFAASLDFDTVLDRVAHLIIDNLADWCAIDLIDDEGNVHRPLVTHADPGKAEAAQRLRGFAPDPETARAVAAVLREGRSILEPQLTESQLAGAAVGEEHLRIMRDLGFKSAMVVPLLTRERLIGAITFVSAESGRRYTAQDLSLAEDVARRAALAIDNARLYRQSQEVQEQLRKANEAKDEFLGLVSHELRTPITTVFGGARVLRSRRAQLAEESQLEILEDIERETERLYRLVEDLLVLARIELGQEIALEPVLVQRVVEKVAKSIEQRIVNHELELQLSEVGAVLGDATYMEQVLRNLVSNAEKYSPAGTPITISVRAEGAEAVVSVLDRGPGIDLEETDAIFERFYRSRAASGRTRGLGLGLTVCKRLIEAQGGRIWARPRDSGGLEVGFAIPLYREEAPWVPSH